MFLPAVSCLNVFGVIYGQELEGVDDDQDPADVRVNLLLPKASAQVLQQSPLVQIGQRAEIVDVQRLREESALHHPPPLLRHSQPHLQVSVADGSVQVFLAQQKAVILSGQPVLQRHAWPQHHALHGTVARVQDPFLAAKLLDLGEHVETRAVQLQPLDDALDDLCRRRHLPCRHGAVDGALGQSARIHAQREVRVLVTPAPSGIMAAHDAAAAPIGTRVTRRIHDIPPADRQTQAAVRTHLRSRVAIGNKLKLLKKKVCK